MKVKKVATLALLVFCVTVCLLNNYGRFNVEHDSPQRLGLISPKSNIVSGGIKHP